MSNVDFLGLRESYSRLLNVTPEERVAQLRDMLRENAEDDARYRRLPESPCPKCHHVPHEGNRILCADYELCCPKCNTTYGNKRPSLTYIDPRSQTIFPVFR